jgi:DNA-binding IclR family transcriptional regulator
MILGAFGARDDSLTLAELTRRTGLPKSTIHRLLGSLVELGAIDTADGRFRLGMRLFELGELVPVQRALRDVALPFMQDLYEATHETVHLGVMDGFDILYVEKISGHRRAGAPSRVDGRLPLHRTGLGKALLAFSPEEVVERVIDHGLPALSPRTITVPSVFRQTLLAIRRRGVAFDNEEAKTGLSCAAAPILDADRAPIAAVSVTGPTPRVNLARLAPAVHATSLALTRAIQVRS